MNSLQDLTSEMVASALNSSDISGESKLYPINQHVHMYAAAMARERDKSCAHYRWGFILNFDAGKDIAKLSPSRTADNYWLPDRSPVNGGSRR